MPDITRREFCRTLVCAGGAVTLGLARASATNRPNDVTSIASAQPVSVESAVSAAQGLIRRLLPGYGDKIACEIISADNGRDVFEIETRDNRLVLHG
ncbi:MAG: alpha-N-acetylglucosaminidase N-terminal domain-containing protein, partial [Limisphaerales bacterium]